MSFYIKGARAAADAGLCGTCRYGFVVKGDRESDRIIRCRSGADAQSPVVRFLVRECTDYQTRTGMDKWEMDKIGWVLEGKRGNLGFRPPKKDE